MTTDLDKQHAIERQKTLRAGLWLVALLLVLGALFFAYRFVTAPVRIAQDTTESAVETVQETATKVLSVRHVEVASGRRFARLADRAHDVLITHPVSAPDGIAERTFRAANLRGAQDRVCEFTLDFGAGPVEVFAAADNDGFATNRAMGGEAERQVRLVFVSEAGALGLNAQTGEDGWALLWRRRNAASKPLDDATAAKRAMDALVQIAKACGPEKPGNP